MQEQIKTNYKQARNTSYPHISKDKNHFFTFIVCYMKFYEMIKVLYDKDKGSKKGEKKQLFKPFKQKYSLKLSFQTCI